MTVRSTPSATHDRRRLAALRLSAQRIGGRERSTPLDTVRWMLALQGQDLPGAKWSIGLRGAGGTERGVEAAFDAGHIVRSWPMRGTLHVVAGEDIGWMLDLTTPAAIASSAQRRAVLGLELTDAERAREVVQRVLAGRQVMTRDATLAAIEAAGVSTAGQRGYHLLWYLAQTGTLVLGPTEGRQQTFALLDDWVPDRRRLERDDALGELALRFFRGHGPATAADLARWAGITMRDVRAGIASCGDRLSTIELGGVSYLLDPEADIDAVTAEPTGRVDLLPGFDEYVLGYKDRSAVLAPEHSAAIVPGGNGVFRPTIVVDGEVSGTWRRVNRGSQVVIEPTLFGAQPRWYASALEAAAEAFGSYLERPVRLA
jgi:hypothetical protein